MLCLFLLFVIVVVVVAVVVLLFFADVVADCEGEGLGFRVVVVVGVVVVVVVNKIINCCQSLLVLVVKHQTSHFKEF